ncbi:hypothetical protein ATCC90586_005725 [Pythium insidiosum]|nr:hypothetical protein ATCC90586_005725 [Pythium insidiosum]
MPASPRVRRPNAPASLRIPSPSHSRKNAGDPLPTRTMTAARSSSPLPLVVSSVVVVLLALELLADPDDTLQWRFWIVTLVFPSRQITWIKVAGVTLGVVLSVCYVVGSRAQLATAEQLMIHSATALVSPLRRSETAKTTTTAAASPTRTASPASFASRCQSLLRPQHLAAASEQGPRLSGQAEDTGDDAEIPQLQIIDESRSVAQLNAEGCCSRRQQVNARCPFGFESEFFQGRGLILVRDQSQPASAPSRWSSLFVGKRRTLWVQLQGRFTRVPPSPSTLYLATELPRPDGFQVAFLTRQVVALLIALVKKFVPSAHVAFGDHRSQDALASELPHAAFPLFQTVDELVVTPDDDTRVPSLGRESFGETSEQRRIRMSTSVGHEPAIRLDATYTFQFHTMYADLAQWKIVNVPGMPEMDLKRFCGPLPIRLAAYYVTRPPGTPAVAASGPHRRRDKAYVFCFAMQHASSESDSERRSLPAMDEQATLLSPTVFSPRRPRLPPTGPPSKPAMADDSGASQPRIRASSSVRSMSPLERARDLANWQFSLPLWVERVDPAAGNRKVAYLFVVQRRQAPASRPRVVVRSAATVKSALFMLDADTPSSQVDGSTLATQFKRLTVESREFLYETIARETQQVAETLTALAARPTAATDSIVQQQQTMLYNCLMSEAQLPGVRSFHEIGVQLTAARRDALDIVLESGSYRLLDRRMLRQEWTMLTTSELQCYRSYTVQPSVSISIAHVLHAASVDDVPFLPVWSRASSSSNATEQRQEEDETGQHKQQWFGIEVHTLTRVLTFFVASAEIRTQWLSSLRQLRALKATRRAPLPPPLALDSLGNSLVTLNHRSCLETWRVRETTVAEDGSARLEAALRRGLALFGRPRDELSGAEVLAFLDTVEALNRLELGRWPPMPSVDEVPTAQQQLAPASLEEDDPDRDLQRMAFALNAYHVLVIYAWLVYGDVATHAQWRKLRAALCLAFGDAARPERLVRISLADLEHGLLRCQPGPGEPPGDPARWPSALIMRHRDFRASLALELNTRRWAASHPLARVFIAPTAQDDGESAQQRSELEKTLNDACAQFLSQELVIDDSRRVIWLPRVCEWNAEDYRPQGAVATGSRAFYCLQQLLPMLHVEQHARVQHLLLGADKECRIKFGKFWTQESANKSGTVWTRPVRGPRDDSAATTASPDERPSTQEDKEAEPGPNAVPRSRSRLGLDRLQSLFQ